MASCDRAISNFGCLAPRQDVGSFHQMMDGGSMMMGPMGALMWVWMFLALAIGGAILVLLVVLILRLAREDCHTSNGPPSPTSR